MTSEPQICGFGTSKCIKKQMYLEDISNNRISVVLRGLWWNSVPLVRGPLVGLLYQTRMFDEFEAVAEWEFRRESKALDENLPQSHFVRHKSHMTWPAIEPRRCGGNSTLYVPLYCDLGVVWFQMDIALRGLPLSA
jgi:hypothetical protein